MRVLVVGSGGREHALARALVTSPRLTELHAAPGNPGIERLGRCHPVRSEDVEGLVDLCLALRIELAVIGPEAPLVAGATDALRRAGVVVFGPSRAAAQIEGSKTFAKAIMQTAGVKTAASLDEARPPCVVKFDGLAAGKGVFVCRKQDEVDAALPRARALGDEVVIEELLEGDEASLFALCDGTNAIALPAARDSKRLLDGDAGPNTGGMGAYSPVSGLGRDEAEALLDNVHRPVLEELARRGTPFVGLLYAGLMLTEDGPRVLEFNCRFGDPETQVVVPRIRGDLLELLLAAATGDLSGAAVEDSTGAAVTVVLASKGYPESNEIGVEIRGIEEAESIGAMVLHAGTARRDGKLLSAGGRVLNVTAVGNSIGLARDLAYAAVERIDFAGAQFRRDIGL